MKATNSLFENIYRVEIYARNDSATYQAIAAMAATVTKRIASGKPFSFDHLAQSSSVKRIACDLCNLTERADNVRLASYERRYARKIVAREIMDLVEC